MSSKPTVTPWVGTRSASAQAFGDRPIASQAVGTYRGKLDPIMNTAARPFRTVDASIGNLPFRETPEATLTKSLHLAPTPLMNAFFSSTNLDAMQKLLAGEVKRRTGFAIGRQSDDDLLIIMRAMYADHAMHAPRSVPGEVARLNRIVLNRIIDQVISAMTAYLAYLRDASRPREPLPIGVATSLKGTRSFELFRRV